MGRIFLVSLFLFACNPKHPSIDTVAENVMDKIETNSGKDSEKNFSEILLTGSRKEKLDSILHLFRADYLRIEDRAKRYLNIEYEDGPLYRFRYMTEKGTELQMELIFEDKKDEPHIKEVTIIPIDSFSHGRLSQIVPYKIRVK